MLSSVDLRWGRQSFRIANTPIWLLPNRSGLNRSFTLDALVAAYAELQHYAELDSTMDLG